MLSSQKDKHFKSKEKVLGQFFTPPIVADFIVSMALAVLGRGRFGCDPACGDGVFLLSMIRHGFEEIVGIDVDSSAIERVPKVVKERARLFVGDGLDRSLVQEDYFDLVAGNPPFSAKYGRVTSKAILSSYELGEKMKSQAIEILFLERFIRLARGGGVVGIIIPDGILLNLNYRYVREFVLRSCKVLAVISLPRGIFNSSKSTTSKTSILILRKGEKHEGETFIAEANSLAELPRILELFKNRISGKNATWSTITSDSLHPKTYLAGRVEFNAPTVKLGDIISKMFTGSTEYGVKRRFSDKGYRYISAKVVTPLGVDFTRDPKYVEPGSSMDKKRAHVKPGDLLFVRVGVGCIGRAAVVVDEADTGVADDWIYVIRLKEGYSPYYLAVFLQSKCGRTQIERLLRGVGTVTIPQTLLKEILVPIPDTELQKLIDSEYKRMIEVRRKGNYQEARKIFENMKNHIEQKMCKEF